MFGLSPQDLDEMVHAAGPDFEALRGAKIFLTGGTGFFGKWLLGALDRAGETLELNMQVTILSRDPLAFLEKYPEAARRSHWNFVAGDVADFAPPAARFDYVIHAAADTTAVATPAQETERTRAIVGGTKQVLDLARKSVVRRVLFISSGAVYGALAGKREGAGEEDFAHAQSVMPYGEAKRVAEAACAQSGLDCVVARAFAFLGPHLPLDAHFAAGNFLRDARRGGPIEVRGDGTALRSYLYPSDLVAWLIGLLARGARGATYNVGSDEVVSTAELARMIAGEVTPHTEVVVQAREPQGPQNIYLPNIARARAELGLEVRVPLREAIQRTLAFHRNVQRRT
jgi:nucleoside-diphosphate-sugar epimerase